VGGELWVPAGQFLRSGKGMANKELSAAKRTRVESSSFILHVNERRTAREGIVV
jgi:hypothetical protein